MTTICGTRDDIRSLVDEFIEYHGRSVSDDVKDSLEEIMDLVEQMRDMGQSMEHKLHSRKDEVQELYIEQDRLNNQIYSLEEELIDAQKTIDLYKNTK